MSSEKLHCADESGNGNYDYDTQHRPTEATKSPEEEHHQDATKPSAVCRVQSPNGKPQTDHSKSSPTKEKASNVGMSPLSPARLLDKYGEDEASRMESDFSRSRASTSGGKRSAHDSPQRRQIAPKSAEVISLLSDGESDVDTSVEVAIHASIEDAVRLKREDDAEMMEVQEDRKPCHEGKTHHDATVAQCPDVEQKSSSIDESEYKRKRSHSAGAEDVIRDKSREALKTADLHRKRHGEINSPLHRLRTDSDKHDCGNSRGKIASSSATASGTGEPRTRDGQRPSQPKQGWDEDKLPFLPPMMREFLSSHGITTVSTFLGTDTVSLAQKLYSSEGFVLGCSLMSWESRKPFDPVGTFETVKEAVKVWKRVLSSSRYTHSNLGDAWDLVDQDIVIRPLTEPSRLSAFLSEDDCHFLRQNFNITTAHQLVLMDTAHIAQRLKEMNEDSDLPVGFCDGVVYSWMKRAAEAIKSSDSETGDSPDAARTHGTAGAKRRKIVSNGKMQSSAKTTGNYHAAGVKLEAEDAVEDNHNSEDLLTVAARNERRKRRAAKTTDDLEAELGKRIGSRFASVLSRHAMDFSADLENAANEKDMERSIWPKRPNAQDTQMTVRPKQQRPAAKCEMDEHEDETGTEEGVKDRIFLDAKNALSRRQQSGKEPMRTALSFDDLLFLQLRGIENDRQLARMDIDDLTDDYIQYRRDQCHPYLSKAVSRRIVERWVSAAAKPRVGSGSSRRSSEPDDDASWDDGKTGEAPLMDNVRRLCKTVQDPVNGLPKKFITAFDCTNDVLYDFVIDIRDSSISGAGRGAFLTFKGARVLKAEARKAFPEDMPSFTRDPQEAILPITRNGLTVRVTGKGVHGDEEKMGSEFGVGLWNQYLPDRDFLPTADNMTFCSLDAGCGLIEIGRYAPLLKSDRKTNLVFALKDFLFSHEPSAWAFDVAEELNGSNAVVDFTSDVTGCPHEEARRNIPMYVNEVGHNDHLQETVVSRDDNRSVFYYIHLRRPIQKGETVELLSDYKTTYEDMRVRKGYGRANLERGVKSDEDSSARLQRNVKERLEQEKFIKSCTDNDIVELLNFVRDGVHEGIYVATCGGENKADSSIHQEVDSENPSRQWIALRRLHWIASHIRLQLQHLSSRVGSPVGHEDDGSSKNGMYHFPVGSLVFVNGWAPSDPRPAYTGLATVEGIDANVLGRFKYSLVVDGSKYFLDVPEAVLTRPTEEELEGAPRRLRAAYDKMTERRCVQDRTMQMNDTLKRMAWSNVGSEKILRYRDEQAAAGNAGRSLFDAMHDELSEEFICQLAASKFSFDPLNEARSCGLSMSLLKTTLYHMTHFVLTEHRNGERARMELSDAIVSSTKDAAQSLRKIADETTRLHGEVGSNRGVTRDHDLLQLGLAFGNSRSSAKRGSKGKRDLSDVWVRTVPDDGSMRKDLVPIEAILNGQGDFRIDVSWYLVHHVVHVAHSLAVLIDWGGPMYSLQKLCAAVNANEPMVQKLLLHGRGD